MSLTHLLISLSSVIPQQCFFLITDLDCSWIMASTPPLSSSSTPPVSTAMDSAALRSCLKCHRRMNSLKYDSHTVCSQCRDVTCSLETRCTECKDWSVEIMTEYLKHRKSLATKRGKKPAVAAASASSQSGRHTYNNVGKTASRLRIVTQSRDNARIIGLSRQRQDSLQTVFRRQQDCPTMGTTVL